MDIDSTIRYAAIQNPIGEKVFGGFRAGIDPILSEEELRMMHYYASQRWQTRQKIEHKIGPNKYAMAEYDKLKRMTFPINDEYLLMLTTEIQNNHTKIIANVLELIGKFSKT